MSDSGDDWLEKHKPGGYCGALESGRRALAHYCGNVWIALHDEEMRLNVIIAWLDEAENIGLVKDRIQQIAAFLDAEDDVWFNFGN